MGRSGAILAVVLATASRIVYGFVRIGALGGFLDSGPIPFSEARVPLWAASHLSWTLKHQTAQRLRPFLPSSALLSFQPSVASALSAGNPPSSLKPGKPSSRKSFPAPVFPRVSSVSL